MDVGFDSRALFRVTVPEHSVFTESLNRFLRSPIDVRLVPDEDDRKISTRSVVRHTQVHALGHGGDRASHAFLDLQLLLYGTHEIVGEIASSGQNHVAQVVQQSVGGFLGHTYVATQKSLVSAATRRDPEEDIDSSVGVSTEL